ncbi:MAG: hypothetical protein TH68_09830 [Candidatus Synechococcus spongiarum 142]|uniref:Uncharacterized protein n=1 Tax=Candidatus Synechococcus spongiarum 142 TaxID=1608213 RepID=A0A6N3X2T8_9SYNE|nr:MAG: hypothetical protein TH68_09830 [Candidatus Synechococcus spongiarum 142]
MSPDPKHGKLPFLELTQRPGVALATYDKALFEAAASEGITVSPAPQLPVGVIDPGSPSPSRCTALMAPSENGVIWIHWPAYILVWGKWRAKKLSWVAMV